MRFAIVAAVAMSWLAGEARATTCFTPPICARLKPDKAFFIGEVISSEDFIGASAIRLFRLQVRVREKLFGLTKDTGEVSVVSHYRHLHHGGLFLFEAHRQGEEFFTRWCGSTDFANSSDARPIIEYLRNVRDDPQNAGSISVQVQGGAEGATITIDGPVRRQAVAKSWETRFEGLPPGTYRVSATHEAFELDNQHPSDSVAIVSSLGCPDLRISLIPKLRISGVTVNAQGDPAPNIALSLKPVGRGIYAVRASSDGQGRFEFPRLYPGSYVLSTAGKERTTFFNGKARLSEAAPIEVRAGAPTEELRLTLLDSGAPRTVRIHATDEQGFPLAGAIVGDYNIGTPMLTDASGLASAQLYEGAHYIILVAARLANGSSGRVWKNLPTWAGRYRHPREDRSRLIRG